MRPWRARAVSAAGMPQPPVTYCSQGAATATQAVAFHLGSWASQGQLPLDRLQQALVHTLINGPLGIGPPPLVSRKPPTS